jgi:SEC-C motif-containing protein
MGRMVQADVTACPCGSGQVYADCCGRFHGGDAAAPTAEALMRSRFSAFALAGPASPPETYLLTTYLLQTWHPSTRPARLDLDGARRWTRLVVLESSGGVFDARGTVRFAAHYEQGGRRGIQHETSAFVREQGRWLYLGEA